MFSSPTNAAAFIRDGKVRALATTNLERSSALPDVPTMAEVMPKFTVSPWLALFGPAGMPPEIVERLNKEVHASFARADVKAQMEKQSFPAQASSPQELASYLKDQLEVWHKTAAEVGIRPE